MLYQKSSYFTVYLISGPSLLSADAGLYCRMQVSSYFIIPWWIGVQVREFEVQQATCFCEGDRPLVEKNIEVFMAHGGHIQKKTHPS